MAATNLFRRLASRLWHRRDGNFAILAGLLTPVVILAAGYGVNVAQISITKSNLLAALDSAVTSTARDLTTGVISEKDASAVVEAFLIANGLRAYAEEGKLNLDSVVINKTDKTVSAKASVILDVAFPLFGTANRQVLAAESEALYSDKKVEVAMMLDLTGSMKKAGADDKLGDLQAAAKNAVTTLLAGPNGNGRVRVALVPYANAVNVGPTIARNAVYVEKKVSERGKVVSNVDPKNVTSSGRPDNCATERVGTAHAYDDVGPQVQMVNRDFLLTGFADGDAGYAVSARCPTVAIVPLTANATTLTGAIDSFAADGGTGGHIGIQWSWYMLSDKWKNVVGTSAAAGPYNDKNVAKYAILMTDGEFNLGFAGATALSEVYGGAAADRSIPHAKRLCAEMRKAGIEIFTIGFKLPNESARDLMRNCATPDTGSMRHFFDASSGPELDQAFRDIVMNIERLVITK